MKKIALTSLLALSMVNPIVSIPNNRTRTRLLLVGGIAATYFLYKRLTAAAAQPQPPLTCEQREAERERIANTLPNS